MSQRTLGRFWNSRSTLPSTSPTRHSCWRSARYRGRPSDRSSLLRLRPAAAAPSQGTLDICVAAVCWWAFGWAIAFGNGDLDPVPGFIGGSADWFYEPSATSSHEGWFFQFAFSAAAATIVSGAVAERTSTTCYVIYSVLLTSFVYPVVVHWQWGSGMTYQMGAVDYAGSGVVHMTGGLAAIIGAAIIGPRRGRYKDGAKPGCCCCGGAEAQEMPAYSIVFQALGTIILWFGWYGFNTGSTLGIVWVEQADGAGVAEAGLVMLNTTLCPAVAGITAMLVTACVDKSNDGMFTLKLGPVLNGILAGLVSITSGCGDIPPGWTCLVGLIGGLVYVGASKMQEALMIDDVVDAGPVHFWCGMWGVIAIALFADDKEYGLAGPGLFYGGGDFLGANIFLIVMILVWVGLTMALVFFVLRAAGMARVSEEVEIAGLDASKHGVKPILPKTVYDSGAVVKPSQDTTKEPPKAEGTPEVKPTAPDV